MGGAGEACIHPLSARAALLPAAGIFLRFALHTFQWDTEALLRLCCSWVLRIPLWLPLISLARIHTHRCAYNTQAYLWVICPTCLYFRIGKDTLSLSFVIARASMDFSFATPSPLGGKSHFYTFCFSHCFLILEEDWNMFLRAAPMGGIFQWHLRTLLFSHFPQSSRKAAGHNLVITFFSACKNSWKHQATEL